MLVEKVKPMSTLTSGHNERLLFSRGRTISIGLLVKGRLVVQWEAEKDFHHHARFLRVLPLRTCTVVNKKNHSLVAVLSCAVYCTLLVLPHSLHYFVFITTHWKPDKFLIDVLLMRNLRFSGWNSYTKLTPLINSSATKVFWLLFQFALWNNYSST